MVVFVRSSTIIPVNDSVSMETFRQNANHRLSNWSMSPNGAKGDMCRAPLRVMIPTDPLMTDGRQARGLHASMVALYYFTPIRTR
jgi:hypothetical protein